MNIRLGPHSYFKNRMCFVYAILKTGGRKEFDGRIIIIIFKYSLRHFVVSEFESNLDHSYSHN